MSTGISEIAQYITFKLGDELFAINVAQVREVLEVSQITRVPTAPAYMRGVVNVRGRAIPVIDLRLKFGLTPTAETVNTRIVVMELELDSELTVVGGIADSVHEVIELEPGQINPPPRIAMRWRTELIRGMARHGEDFIIILDIGAVFTLDELAVVSSTAATEAVPAKMRDLLDFAQEQVEIAPDGLELSRETYDRFASLVTGEVGIKMTGEKSSMIRGRLMRRLRDLNLPSLDAYCDYLFDPVNFHNECVHFIDAITTNTTDFFREPQHFEYLTGQVLPKWEQAQNGGRFLLWSAGCSTGEEPYTQAVVLNEYARRSPGFDFSILATDVSHKVLKHAGSGIYERARLDPVALDLRGRYFRRGKNASSNLVRISPDVRKKVSFHHLNFMDNDYCIRNMFDAVFIRNVLIYFEKSLQETVINKICRNLHPGGYLFVGHSESLIGLSVPLKLIAPAVYRKNPEPNVEQRKCL